MTASDLRAFDANQRLRAAHAQIKKALGDLDRELRQVERRGDLYDGEKRERAAKLRDDAQRAIRAGRAEMDAIVAEGRRVARLAPHAPSGEELQRRAYYAQRAASELGGLGPDEALAIVQRVVDGGDPEAAQEYVVAARPIAARAARNADLLRLERAVEPKEAKVKRAMGAAMDTLAGQNAWFDGHLTDAVERAGQVPQAVREGREAEQPMDTRRVDLWLGNTEQKMVDTFETSFGAGDGAEG